ncbi:MAG: MraY family glycosyltransferase [Thermoanaerobacteraceae bacterium]|nr:MraY family glycosyltransferase [Thermoanaerobacteraceae bacterium]
MKYLLLITFSFLIAYMTTPLAKGLAIKLGAIDMPGEERRIHSRPIPRMGGLAIYTAFILSILVFMPMDKKMLGLILASSLIVLVGIVDDIKSLSAVVKMGGQIAAAIILVLFGFRIEWLTSPLDGMIYLGWLSIPATIFWIVGITNTFNLIDGLDGLAAGISAISSVTMSAVALLNGRYTAAMLLLIVAGAALGFLPHNFNPAKIFMGDTGSLFLGFVLSAISIQGTIKGATAIAIVIPVLAMGLPIFDTAIAIIRRAKSGMPIMQPDRGHLHHRLLDMGFTQRQVVMILYFISGILGVVAIAITEVTPLWSIVLFLSVCLAAFVGTKRMGLLNPVEEKNINA